MGQYIIQGNNWTRRRKDRGYDLARLVSRWVESLRSGSEAERNDAEKLLLGLTSKDGAAIPVLKRAAAGSDRYVSSVARRAMARI